MAVGDTSFPSPLLLLPPHHNNNNNNNNKNNHLHVHVPTQDKDNHFISEFTHQMSHFMLQDDIHDSFTSKLPWDITFSPDSTLWSPISEESSQEQSPPVTPCWKTNKFESNNTMKINDEKVVSKQNHGYEIQNSSSNGICSHQTLIEEQIRAIEIRKQHALFHQKQKSVGGGQGQVQWARPPRLAQPPQTGGGSGLRAVFIGGSGSRSGTGVFLPRVRTVAPSESTKIKQGNMVIGKGCSTVLIPARVVHALQQHFDKTSRPKVVAFPPLRDVVENPQRSMKALEDVHNDLILPNEWTY